MKKLTVLTLCCAMVLSMAACASNTAAVDNQTKQNVNTEAATTKYSAEQNMNTEAATKGDSDGKSDAADGSEQNAADLEAFLNNFIMIGPSEDLFYTGWEFAGGMVDGVEMNEKDALASLTVYGGKLQLIFENMGQISMVQGSGTLSGSYTVADDGITMKIVFDNNGTELSYDGLYVYNVDNIPVFLLLPDASGKNALYFTQIDER